MFISNIVLLFHDKKVFAHTALFFMVFILHLTISEDSQKGKMMRRKEGRKPKKVFGRVLDRNILSYNKMAISPEEAAVKSMNNLSKEIEKIKEHVKKGTFFSEYVPKRKALSDELDNLK